MKKQKKVQKKILCFSCKIAAKSSEDLWRQTRNCIYYRHHYYIVFLHFMLLKT